MGINKLKVVLTEKGELPAIAELMTGADTGFPYDGAKEHYILDIEHRDKAIDIIETLLPAIPYPKKKKKRDWRQRVVCGLSAFFRSTYNDSMLLFIAEMRLRLFVFQAFVAINTANRLSLSLSG